MKTPLRPNDLDLPAGRWATEYAAHKSENREHERAAYEAQTRTERKLGTSRAPTNWR
jgi:hypothetical protein